MAKQKPTHIPLFFIRSIRIRKEHLADARQPDPETPNDLMEIVNRGEVRRIQYSTALDFIVSGTALENSQANQKAIADHKSEWAERAKLGQTSESTTHTESRKTRTA